MMLKWHPWWLCPWKFLDDRIIELKRQDGYEEVVNVNNSNYSCRRR